MLYNIRVDKRNFPRSSINTEKSTCKCVFARESCFFRFDSVFREITGRRRQQTFLDIIARFFFFSNLHMCNTIIMKPSTTNKKTSAGFSFNGF